MNLKTTLIFMTLAAAAFAVVLAPSLGSTVSAAPNTVCTKNGHSPPGQDEPNTPPGKADCPPPFKARNAQSVK